MDDAFSLLVMLVITGALMLFFFGAARAAGKPVPKDKRAVDDAEPVVGPLGGWDSRRHAPNLGRDEDEERGDWLDQPGDDLGSGWTNFDYIAAGGLEDDWDGEG